MLLVYVRHKFQDDVCKNMLCVLWLPNNTTVAELLKSLNDYDRQTRQVILWVFSLNQLQSCGYNVLYAGAWIAEGSAITYCYVPDRGADNKHCSWAPCWGEGRRQASRESTSRGVLSTTLPALVPAPWLELQGVKQVWDLPKGWATCNFSEPGTWLRPCGNRTGQGKSGIIASNRGWALVDGLTLLLPQQVEPKRRDV